MPSRRSRPGPCPRRGAAVRRASVVRGRRSRSIEEPSSSSPYVIVFSRFDRCGLQPGPILREPRFIGVDRRAALFGQRNLVERSEEHTSELQSLMRISYAVFCLKKKKNKKKTNTSNTLLTM